MTGKFDNDLSTKMPKRWIPWLRTNTDMPKGSVIDTWEKLISDLERLTVAQLKLVLDLVQQMKLANEEDKKTGQIKRSTAVDGAEKQVILHTAK